MMQVGGQLSDYREVQGFRIPFNVEAGNIFGTDEYFVFFRATVTAVRFLAPGSWSLRTTPTLIHSATG